MGFVDLHAHVLPGVDDGPTDLPATLAALRGLAGLGFERVYATPHQKASDLDADPATVLAAYHVTTAAARAADVPLSVGLAAENYWDDRFFARIQDGSVARYDDGRAFLFELGRHDVPARFEDSLFHMAARGLLPVMAHPERYGVLYRQTGRLERLARTCALVVDLAALAGGLDRFRERHLARHLVAERIAHAAASDLHSQAGIHGVARGIEWVRKRLGPAAVTRLLVDNPRRIAAGELPE